MSRIKSIVMVGTAMFFSACSTVPLTGRQQLSLVSDDQMVQMGFQAYNEFLTENKAKVLPSANSQSQRVKQVGQNLINSVKNYMNSSGYGDQIANYQWEVNVVDNKEQNAWCMPGGKIVVYTGILPVTGDDAGLATVMGHEIAHAIARHGAERVSQQQLAQGVGAIGGVATANSKYQGVFNQLYGVGGPLVLLSYSRKQELEADRLGLIFMAMAGYNPATAVSFWERMSSSKSGQQAPPEFMSTHPSDATRIAQIQQYLPEAQKFYKTGTGPMPVNQRTLYIPSKKKN